MPIQKNHYSKSQEEAMKKNGKETAVTVLLTITNHKSYKDFEKKMRPKIVSELLQVQNVDVDHDIEEDSSQSCYLTPASSLDSFHSATEEVKK